jgi:hypothetical protein
MSSSSHTMVNKGIRVVSSTSNNNRNHTHCLTRTSSLATGAANAAAFTGVSSSTTAIAGATASSTAAAYRNLSPRCSTTSSNSLFMRPPFARYDSVDESSLASSLSSLNYHSHHHHSILFGSVC